MSKSIFVIMLTMSTSSLIGEALLFYKNNKEVILGCSYDCKGFKLVCVGYGPVGVCKCLHFFKTKGFCNSACFLTCVSK